MRCLAGCNIGYEPAVAISGRSGGFAAHIRAQRADITAWNGSCLNEVWYCVLKLRRDQYPDDFVQLATIRLAGTGRHRIQKPAPLLFEGPRESGTADTVLDRRPGSARIFGERAR